MSGPVTVEITAKRTFQSVVVRPLSRGIRPTVRVQRIAFTLGKPGQVTVEFDGPHHALHLFADLPETDEPQANAAKVRYFGPGVHRPGKIQLQSGETLYISGGAVVCTAISAHGAAGVRIDLAARGNNTQTTVERRLGKIKAERILFLGNSITACPPTWWGLSASAAAKDFAHLLAAAIDAKCGGRLTMIPTTAPTTNPDGSVDMGPSNGINIADVFERGYASYHATKISKQIAWKADIVVLQFGENIPMATFNASVFKSSLKSLLTDLKASSNPHIFMPSYILGTNPTVDAIKRSVCAEDPTYRVFVDLSSVSKDPSNMGAYGHPGNKGMQLIADMLFKVILEH